MRGEAQKASSESGTRPCKQVPSAKRTIADRKNGRLLHGDALECYDNHVWTNASVVVWFHHFGMSGFKRAQRHHVQVRLEAFKFDGFCVGSIVSSMGRVVGGDLTCFEIQNVESFLCRRL